MYIVQYTRIGMNDRASIRFDILEGLLHLHNLAERRIVSTLIYESRSNNR